MARTDLRPILIRLRPNVSERLEAYVRAHEVSRSVVIHAALVRFLEVDAAVPLADRLARLKVPE